MDTYPTLNRPKTPNLKPTQKRLILKREQEHGDKT